MGVPCPPHQSCQGQSGPPSSPPAGQGRLACISAQPAALHTCGQVSLPKLLLSRGGGASKQNFCRLAFPDPAYELWLKINPVGLSRRGWEGEVLRDGKGREPAMNMQEGTFGECPKERG